MAIEGKVRTLYTDKTQQEAIFPTTKISAVTDDEGNGLNTLLEHIAYVDPMDMESAAVLANADLLGGYPASDYVTKIDLDNFKNEISSGDNEEDESSGLNIQDFGWGTNNLPHISSLDTEIDHGIYRYDGNGSMPGWGILMQLANRDYGYGKQIFYSFGSGVDYPTNIAVRSNVWGSWFPWEWINPPMEFNTEYRLCERHNSKPVYTQKFDLGKISNGLNKSIFFYDYLSQDSMLLDIDCMITGEGMVSFKAPLTTSDKLDSSEAAECYFQYGTLYVQANTTYANEGNVTVTVKYYKEND